MANPQNLVRNEDRTPSERRENARKAGKASGEARRKKKAFRESLLMLLETENKDGKNYQDAVVVGLVKRAASGDPRAIELMLEIIGESPKNNTADSQNLKKAKELLRGVPDALE